jgi:hypothetical protein
MFGIMEYRNKEANKAFTIKAHQSAIKMENLTEHMRQIAEKTEQETVFMRIITIVTLFFLPGTFVSVCTSVQSKFPGVVQ